MRVSVVPRRLRPVLPDGPVDFETALKATEVIDHVPRYLDEQIWVEFLLARTSRSEIG